MRLALFLDGGCVHAVAFYGFGWTVSACGWRYERIIEAEGYTVVTCLPCLAELQAAAQTVEVPDRRIGSDSLDPGGRGEGQEDDVGGSSVRVHDQLPDAPCAEQKDSGDMSRMPRIVVKDDGLVHDCAKPFTKTDIEGLGNVLTNCGKWCLVKDMVVTLTVTCIDCLARGEP